MKTRHVFSTANIDGARKAMTAARGAGIADDDISLVARSDISLDRIPDDRKLVTNDFYPAAARGALAGGASGLLAGLVALTTPIGLTLAGVGAMVVAGVATGAWVSALVGASVPDAVHRQFDDEIRAGKILVVIDGDFAVLEKAATAMQAVGARQLDFSQVSALS